MWQAAAGSLGAGAQEREDHGTHQVESVGGKSRLAVRKRLAGEAAVAESQHDDLVAQHHRFTPYVGGALDSTQELEELGQPPHGWGRPFDEERNIAERLLEVLGAVLGREPKIGDPGKRRRNLDRHFGQGLVAGTLSRPAAFHDLLTHGAPLTVAFAWTRIGRVAKCR